jgi:hypothetical protein
VETWAVGDSSQADYCLVVLCVWLLLVVICDGNPVVVVILFIVIGA